MKDPESGGNTPINGALEAGAGASPRSRDDRFAKGAPEPNSAQAPAFNGYEDPTGIDTRRSENQDPAGQPPAGETGTATQIKSKGKRRRRRSKRRRNSAGAAPNARSHPNTAAADGSVDHGAAAPNGASQDNGHGTTPDRDRHARPNGNPAPRPQHPYGGKPRRDRGMAPVYAALDLGTNNCRLLVAIPTRPGQFRVIDAFSRIVRLGEGLSSSGRLSDAAMDRAIDALKICAGKLASKTIRRHRLIATEACRSASNGATFLDRVKAETGLELEIVDRETEARLAVSGCSSLVERETDGVVLFDIGGGSSEIAAIDLSGSRSNRLANHISAWTSLPVGVVTLSERHGGRDVTRRIFGDMVEEVADLLADFPCPDLPGCGNGAGDTFHLLGTSGTVTTLAGVHLDLPRYDRRRVDGLWLSSSEVDLMTQKLLSWDFQARSSNPCIGSDRADLVLAGCAILEAIRLRWPSERLRVADRGLREGLLTEMMAADGVWRRGRGRRPFYKRNPKPRDRRDSGR